MRRPVIFGNDDQVFRSPNHHGLIEDRGVADTQNQRIKHDAKQEGADPEIAVHLNIAKSRHAHGDDPGQETAAKVADFQKGNYLSVVLGHIHHHVRHIDQRDQPEDDGHVRVQVLVPAEQIHPQKRAGSYGSKDVIEQLERHHTTSFSRYLLHRRDRNTQSGSILWLLYIIAQFIPFFHRNYEKISGF